MVFYISGDWRCDQYRWNQYGCKLLPTSDHKVKKYYFDTVKADNSRCNKFQRFAIHLLCNFGLVLMHNGNQLEAEDHPHGNSASSFTPYIRTCPSVIKQIKDRDPSEFPSTFYKKKLYQQPVVLLNQILRNRRQLVNHKALERQKLMMNCTTFMKLRMILMVLLQKLFKLVCSHPKMLTEMNNLLQISNNNNKISNTYINQIYSIISC